MKEISKIITKKYWFNHVEITDENKIGKTTTNARPWGTKNRGRPPKRWP